MYKRFILLLLFGLYCSTFNAAAQGPFLLVLGIAQDGSYPQVACTKACCRQAWLYDSLRRYVVSLALVNPGTKQWWLIEAGPDMKEQLQYFNSQTHGAYPYLPSGIFITHAHIGHYLGLAQLGREVLNTHDLPVYVLPRLKQYLENNGPWSQLVSLQNIRLQSLDTSLAIPLITDGVPITMRCFTVPHRDEYAETAGFTIALGTHYYLFIPDIDKWQKWNKSIVALMADTACAGALIDGTFLSNNELPGRTMTEVPHPFISETMQLFKAAPAATKAKIKFIHFNHTNPMLYDASERLRVQQLGFSIAAQGEVLQ